MSLFFGMSKRYMKGKSRFRQFLVVLGFGAICIIYWGANVYLHLTLTIFAIFFTFTFIGAIQYYRKGDKSETERSK